MPPSARNSLMRNGAGLFTYIKNTIEEYLSYKPEPYELVVDNQTIKEKAF